jgi:hypothetical protein
MITRTWPCLVRRQREVFRDQHYAGDEPVPELIYHAKKMASGIKKADLEEADCG